MYKRNHAPCNAIGRFDECASAMLLIVSMCCSMLHKSVRYKMQHRGRLDARTAAGSDASRAGACRLPSPSGLLSNQTGTCQELLVSLQPAAASSHSHQTKAVPISHSYTRLICLVAVQDGTSSLNTCLHDTGLQLPIRKCVFTSNVISAGAADCKGPQLTGMHTVCTG